MSDDKHRHDAPINQPIIYKPADEHQLTEIRALLTELLPKNPECKYTNLGAAQSYIDGKFAEESANSCALITGLAIMMRALTGGFDKCDMKELLNNNVPTMWGALRTLEPILKLKGNGYVDLVDLLLCKIIWPNYSDYIELNDQANLNVLSDETWDVISDRLSKYSCVCELHFMSVLFWCLFMIITNS